MAVLNGVAPAQIGPQDLTAEERAAADRLLKQLLDYQRANARQIAYYEGRQRVRDLGISIPPSLTDLMTVVGWPGTVVDVLEERLDHDGWVVPGQRGDLGVSEIIADNQMAGEWSGARVETLIYGVVFGVVGKGGQGEPDPLVTLESPTRMTVTWDPRRRRVTEALLASTDDKRERVTGATLWTSTHVIEMAHDVRNGWVLERRTEHRLGWPAVARITNRPRLGDKRGRSEITRAIRAYTDHAVRTVLGMEVAREFFAAPMLWVLGADESSFTDAAGNPKGAWETYIGRIKAIEGDEDGHNPDVKQFSGSSPAPFIESLRGLSQMVAAEAGMPTSYLGLLTENPPSADSVRALESRLIKRAERRGATMGPEEGWLMRLAVWVRDGEDPGVTPLPLYRDPATPTRSAAADETQKLVEAGVLPPDGVLTQRRIGLSEADREQLALDRRRSRASETLTALAAAAEQADER